MVNACVYNDFSRFTYIYIYIIFIQIRIKYMGEVKTKPFKNKTCLIIKLENDLE